VQDRLVAACDLGLVEGSVGGEQRFVVRLCARVEERGTDADGGINPAGTDGVRLLAYARAEPVGEALDELRRRAAEHGGELVAPHASQCLIWLKALREYVRDAPDQSLRGARTAPMDQIAVCVHVDGEKREVLAGLP
jgi:hypothetical protein